MNQVKTTTSEVFNVNILSLRSMNRTNKKRLCNNGGLISWESENNVKLEVLVLDELLIKKF